MNKPSIISIQRSNIGTWSLYIFFGLLAYMPLHILISTWLGSYLGLLDLAKVFKDIILVFGFLLAAFVGVFDKSIGEIFKSRIVWLIIVYALLTVLLAVFKPTDTDAEILAVVYNLRFLIFFVYALLLCKMYRREWLIRRAIQTVLIVGAVVLAFGVVQYLWLPDNALVKIGYSRENGVLPAFFIDDKPDLERVMSTLRDPNSFGSYVIILLSIALVYYLNSRNQDLKKMLTGFVALALMCLWFSFSRSAWLGALLALGVAGWLWYKQEKSFKFSRKILVAAAALPVLALLVLIPLRNSYFVKNVVFHADESTVLEDPNELRAKFWQRSIKSAADEPLGYGPGTAGLASIRNDKQGTVLNENYYFQILHESGVFGLLLFLASIAIALKRLYSLSSTNPLALALFASGLGLLFTNLLVHIWSNEAVAYTWWGLSGLVFFHGLPRRNKVHN